MKQGESNVELHTERMQQIDPANLDRAFKALFGLGGYVLKSGLERSLLDLVNMRASQINGCAYCLDMHSKDLRASGETEQRLYLLNAWREAPSFYSDRERAALAWAEAVTLVADSHVPDEVYEEVRQHFTDDELFTLTMAVASINVWNRFNVAARTVAGSYEVPAGHGAAVTATAAD